jgi:hypothetical protein
MIYVCHLYCVFVGLGLILSWIFFYFMRSLHEVHRANAYGMAMFTTSHFITPKISKRISVKFIIGRFKTEDCRVCSVLVCVSQAEPQSGNSVPFMRHESSVLRSQAPA